MSNPSKAKGRAEENRIADMLRLNLWPDAVREGKNAPSMDLINTGRWRVEIKHRASWRMFEWIRASRFRSIHSLNGAWAIIATHGDRRTVEGRGVGTVVVLDIQEWIRLMRNAGEGDRRLQ